MKRVLALCLLLLTASVAEARQVSTDLLVVTLNSNKAAGATQGKSDVLMGTWVDENVTAILNEWGVRYIKYPAATLPTGKMEWLRTGKVVMGPDTITARAVLHERFALRSASFDYPAYRPDSLTRSVVVNGTPMLPSVPSLFILEPQNSNGDLAVSWRRTTACSLGVTGGSAQIVGGAGIGHECEACLYATNDARAYFGTGLNQAAALDLSTVGGVLPVLSVYGNHTIHSGLDETSGAVYSFGVMPSDLMWGRVEGATDTTGLYGRALYTMKHARPDTAVVFKRLNKGWNVLDADGNAVAAAQMVVTNGPAVLGVDGGVSDTRADFMYDAVFVGLAALDSLCGGDLIGARKVRGHEVVPKKIALTIDGGFARCNAQFSTGTYITDSTAVKATLDSLAARGIPYLVGVNVDSVAAYPYERAWYKGAARFTPQVWRGANGGVCDTTTRYKLTDLFGHSRARSAYGPAVWRGSAADTSTFALTSYAFARNDSLFPGRTSRFLLPPYDDIVPTNTALADSMFIAARLAGASGIRLNGLDTLRVARQSSNVQGYRFGLKALSHSGEIALGGSRLLSLPGVAGVNAESFENDSGYAYPSFCKLADKALSALVRGPWHGYLGNLTSSQFGAVASAAKPNVAGSDWSYDQNSAENAWSLATNASLLKTSMSALGGSTHVGSLVQPQGAALRPGWWPIRSVDGFRAVANAVAGRTLIMWTYPESIEP